MDETLQAVTALAAEAADVVYRDWEEGRAPSPAAADFVISAERLLLKAVPGYRPVSLECRDDVATRLYEQQEEGRCQEPAQIADFVVEQLFAAQ